MSDYLREAASQLDETRKEATTVIERCDQVIAQLLARDENRPRLRLIQGGKDA